MDDCTGEREAIPAVPGSVDPVHGDPFVICPCVSLDGSQAFVAVGVDSPVAGGDYNLAFVS